MIFEYAKNPVWVNEQHTMIDLIVKFKHLNSEVPFTADFNDCEAHGRDIFALAANGEFGEIAPFVPPPEPDPNIQTVTITPSSGSIPGSIL